VWSAVHEAAYNVSTRQNYIHMYAMLLYLVGVTKGYTSRNGHYVFTTKPHDLHYYYYYYHHHNHHHNHHHFYFSRDGLMRKLNG
jgi:hypothetical protein